MSFFEWPLKTGFTVYNKVKWVSNLRFLVKKKFPTDRPIPVKQGRVRRNKNIFKVGLKLNKQEGPWALGHLRMTNQWSGTICEILVECLMRNNSVKLF